MCIEFQHLSWQVVVIKGLDSLLTYFIAVVIAAVAWNWLSLLFILGSVALVLVLHVSGLGLDTSGLVNIPECIQPFNPYRRICCINTRITLNHFTIHYHYHHHCHQLGKVAKVIVSLQHHASIPDWNPHWVYPDICATGIQADVFTGWGDSDVHLAVDGQVGMHAVGKLDYTERRYFTELYKRKETSKWQNVDIGDVLVPSDTSNYFTLVPRQFEVLFAHRMTDKTG